MSFGITGLPAEDFTPLFAVSDEELARQGAVRRIADERTPGHPCRISLTDARAGDKLLHVPLRRARILRRTGRPRLKANRRASLITKAEFA
jgi:hypothetical protein